MVHNSQALLAFFAVSNVDLIVARHTLDSHDAGLYAAGLILAKAVLFLPQFVSIVAFPSMASGDRPRTFVMAVGAVVVLGAVATLATALLPGLALIFVGGSQYGDVRSRLWIFAGDLTNSAMARGACTRWCASSRRSKTGTGP